jgi:peroxiredoxin
VLVAIGVSTFEPQHGLLGSDAPRFALPTSAGTEVTLDQILADGNQAMLYFSMGVGCDGCFAQIPEIDETLAARGVTLVPVMVDPAEMVANESLRFGIVEPILIDQDRSVSNAYEMLGVYGHSDRPSHSFALVGGDGQVEWVKHYATMFVSAEEFLAEVPGL